MYEPSLTCVCVIKYACGQVCIGMVTCVCAWVYLFFPSLSLWLSHVPTHIHTRVNKCAWSSDTHTHTHQHKHRNYAGCIGSNMKDSRDDAPVDLVNLNVYIHICVHVCVCAYIHIFMYISIYIYTWIYKSVYIFICIHMYVCICICVCECVCVFVCVCVCVHDSSSHE